MGPILLHLRVPFARRLLDQSGEQSRFAPKVSWLNSKKLEVVWPGRLKKVGESGSRESDATTGTYLNTHTTKDEEIALPPKIASPSVTASPD